MYTQFFGLREKPFAITPDPQYLFLSHRHGEALAHLLYGVTESGGFVQLTGEVGTGKTLLTRTLLDRLPANVDLALVLNPRLSAHEFIEAIFDELHIPLPVGATIKQLVDSLNQHLLEVHAQGRRAVLLVDEAQNLDADVLEQLRLLTNLETARDKLLQIILVGQPELRQTLARNDLRQLAQRITGRYHLGNLSQAETAAYVEHRLKVAGAERRIFTRGAIGALYKATGGVPRLINIICDRALLGAYTEEKAMVGRQLVREAAAEVSGRAAPARIVSWAPEAGVAAAVVAASALVLWLFLSTGEPDAATASAPSEEPPVQSAAVVPAAPAATRNSLRLARSLSSRTTTLAPQASLTDVLERAGSLTGTDAAMRGLLRLWGTSLRDPGPPPCEQVREQDLKCEFQVGSWTLLEQLDRPVILSLVAPGGDTHQVVMAGIDGDKARLLLGNQYVQVPVNQVRELWFGESLLIWKPNPVADSLMVPGIRSNGVAWLRQTLEQLQGGESITSNYYDRTLTERVRAFQRSAQLEADGKAGVLTLIALNNTLAGHDGPRLKQAN